MVGMFLSLCLASQKPSEREFFVPARRDVGVKLLNILWQRFVWWGWWLVHPNGTVCMKEHDGGVLLG